MSKGLQAAIFDMDGVIVNTVPLHRNYDDFHESTFTFKEYKEKVDGIPRQNGAQAILTELSPEEIDKACEKKQKYFSKFLEEKSITVYKSTINLIKELKKKNFDKKYIMN